MSGWEAWIDALCAEHQTPDERQESIKEAAIIGLDGSVWAKSAPLPEISESEALAIARGFEQSAQLAQHGIIVAGTKYTFVQGSGDVIRGVRSYLVRDGGVDEDGEPTGTKHTVSFVAKKTNTAFVVGIFSPEDILKETANNHIETVASALIASGV